MLKNINNCSRIETLNELNSDHLPVLLELSRKTLNLQNNAKVFLNCKLADKFRKISDENLSVESRFTSRDCVLRSIQNITKVIRKANAESISTHSYVTKEKPLSAEKKINQN